MPTQTQYRRDLALKAAMLKIVTPGVLYSGTYQGVASGADAARRIVSSDLGHVGLAGNAAELPSTAADYQWVYVPDVMLQRRIVKNGYQSYALASEVLTGHNAGADDFVVGYVTLDRSLGAALADPLVEMLGRFPVLGYEDIPGLHWGINEALNVMHWPRKEAVTGNGTGRIDVAALFPWLKRPEQLIRVFDQDPSNGGEPSVMGGRAWLEPDGEKVYLHIPKAIASGATFTIQVRRPCSTWIKVSGTWASSTVGLVNEADEALPDVDRVTAVAYWQLCVRMARRGPMPQQDAWAKEAAAAAAVAAPFVTYQNEPPTPPSRRIPRHPTGKSWRSSALGARRWP